MSDLFSALSSPVRRDIIAILRESDRTAGEVAERLDVSKPTLSGHFNVLKDAGLVHARRQGTTITYSLNASILEDLLARVADLFGKSTRKEGDTS